MGVARGAAIVAPPDGNGAWQYPGGGIAGHRASEDYDQLETFRNLGILVEKYGFDRRHPAIQAAAEYLFSKQTTEGDLRGIYGNQYSPNYSAAMMELLIKAAMRMMYASGAASTGCSPSARMTAAGPSPSAPTSSSTRRKT